MTALTQDDRKTYAAAAATARLFALGEIRPDGTLVLQPTQDSAHAVEIFRTKHAPWLSKALQPWNGDQPVPIEVVEATAQGKVQSPAQDNREQRKALKEERQKHLLSLPLVQDMSQRFDAKVVRVDASDSP